MTPREAYYECRYKYYECRYNKKRDKDLEKIIIKDPYYAYSYATNVIKSRWIEAENIICTSSEYTYWYAVDVIKARLPENMHNAMLLYADDWAKLYLDFINKTKETYA